MSLEELYKNLQEAGEIAAEARLAWERHMKKIDWDMERADEAFKSEMNGLWGQVDITNEQYNQAHMDIKKALTGSN